jgi:hypothetical protein
MIGFITKISTYYSLPVEELPVLAITHYAYIRETNG